MNEKSSGTVHTYAQSHICQHKKQKKTSGPHTLPQTQLHTWLCVTRTIRGLSEHKQIQERGHGVLEDPGNTNSSLGLQEQLICVIRTLSYLKCATNFLCWKEAANHFFFNTFCLDCRKALWRRKDSYLTQSVLEAKENIQLGRYMRIDRKALLGAAVPLIHCWFGIRVLLVWRGSNSVILVGQ